MSQHSGLPVLNTPITGYSFEQRGGGATTGTRSFVNWCCLSANCAAMNEKFKLDDMILDGCCSG